jgi:arginine decarboxylase
VIITSPTYEGFVAPVGEIARVVRTHPGNPVFGVDAAWAAHFPFHPALPAWPMSDKEDEQ